MHITLLYIEDDFIDAKNMEWVCDHFEQVSLQIVDSFEQAKNVLATQEFDLVITDQNVHQDKLKEQLSLFENKTFYVLSNAVSIDAKVTAIAKGIIKKPLTKDKIANLLGITKPIDDNPNLSYFKVIDNPEAKTEMLLIIQNELENAKEQIPDLVAENNSETLKNLVHKLASKFSVLGMQATFELVAELEKELKNGTIPLEKVSFLERQIANALTFLNQEKE